MKRKIAYAAAAAAVLGVLVFTTRNYIGETALADSGDVITSFATPEGTMRFSQGLAYDGTDLLYLDDEAWYVYEGGPVWKPGYFVITTTGSVVSSFLAPATDDGEYSHKGLTWDGTRLWVSRAGSYDRGELYADGVPGYITTPNVYPYDIEYVNGFIYEVDGITGWVYKIETPGGPCVSSFPGPTCPDERYFGLTSDGTNLYLGTYGRNDRVYKYNLGGTLISSFLVPSCPNPMGLACDGSYLWCVDDDLDYIYKLVK